MPKKLNFGSPNLTKQKKKPRNTAKCHTKKNPRNTTKCHNIFTIFFLFPTVVGLRLILLFYFLCPQHFHRKFLVKIINGFKIMQKKKKKQKKLAKQENCV